GVERHHPRVLRRIALREALAAEQVEARLEGARGVAWLEVAGGGVVEMPPSAGPPHEGAVRRAIAGRRRDARDGEVGDGVLERRRRRGPDAGGVAEDRGRGAAA